MGKSRKPKRPIKAVVLEQFENIGEELANQGERFLQQGDFDKAKTAFQKSLESKNSPEVMFSLACCLLELSEPEEAKRYLERSCELAPDAHPDKWLTLAELENGRNSLRCLERAAGLLERDLENPTTADIPSNEEDKENYVKSVRRKLSNVYVCLFELFTTDLCDEQNAEGMAVSFVEKSLEMDSENPEALQAKASYYLIEGDYNAAKCEIKKSLEKWLPAFERAVEGRLENMDEVPPFNVRLAAVKLLLELDMFAEASVVLDGLALEDEDCVDVWYLLGWLNYLQGSDYMTNAKFYLKKAAKVAAEYKCDDERLCSHIGELLEELKHIESDDDEESEADWVTDDDEDSHD